MAALALGVAPATLALVLAAAFAAGFVDSIVGGGGLIQLPALLSGFSGTAPRVLLGTNKLGSIFGTTSAVFRYAQFVQIPWRAILPSAVLACGAAFIGASLVSRLPPAAFRPLVPFMLAAVLVYVVSNRSLGAVHAPAVLTRRKRMAAHSGIAAIGFYDGFFGPGTGGFLMLLFIRAYGFDFLHAAAAARLVNVATNAGALIYFGCHAQIHWELGLGLGLFNASGSVLGTRTARKHGTKLVRTLFIVVVVALISKTGWDALRH